jgi:hypothetical protein
LAGEPSTLDIRNPEAGLVIGASASDRLARFLPALAGVAVAAVVVVNAWSGLMPGVGFWDTGEFQTVLPVLGTAHPTGYPTYVLIGFIANLLLSPIGEPALRINALSLLAVAGAAGLTVELVRRLTGYLALGVAAGLGLALTPFVWANATRADPHPLHLFFVALLLVLLVGWAEAQRSGSTKAGRLLIGAAVAFGLAAGNHSLTLLMAPPIALYVLAVHPGIVRRPRLIATCAVVLAATLLAVYLELPIRAGLIRAPLVYAKPDTWDGFWYIALAEQFRGSLAGPLEDLPRKSGDLWSLATSQFGALALLIPVGFIATARRVPRYALLTGSAMVITVVFNAAYSNADINRYYLGPILWAWTWIACLAGYVVDAIVAIWAAVTRRRPEAMAAAAAALAVLVGVGLVLPALGDLSTRRTNADRSGDTDAATWLDQALPSIAQGAVLVSWWSTSTPLWYAEFVEGRRTDIDIVDDRTILDRDYGSAVGVIDRFFGTRPVYVIRANNGDLAGVEEHYRLRPVAGSSSLTVYEVLGPAGAG